MTNDNIDDKLLPLISTANNAIEDEILAKQPNLTIAEGSPFFEKTRDVAMLHLESLIRRNINHLYHDAEKMYAEYERKLKVLIGAIWAAHTTRNIQSTSWGDDLYRPYSQDFGVPIDY